MVFAEDPPTDRWPDEDGRASAQTDAHAAQSSELLPFVWAKDVSDGHDDSLEIVEDVLTTGAMSVFYGESNSGKTYLVLDLAKSIAKGIPWLGRRTTQGCVIYVAAEGAKTIERRLRAIRETEPNEPDYPLGVVKTSINMASSTADTELLAALALTRAREWSTTPCLIVIDTLSRVLAGGNENDSTDMGALVRNSDLLRELTGAHILWVHHAGKDTTKGARGHSLLRAAVDTEVEILHDEASGIRTAKIAKQRDLGSHGLQLSAKLRPIDLGTNQWGNPITACVVESLGDSENPVRSPTKRLKGHAASAFRMAQSLVHDAPLTTQTSAIPGGKQIIPVDKWRDQFMDSVAEISATAARSAWSRSFLALQEAGLIGSHKSITWIW